MKVLLSTKPDIESFVPKSCDGEALRQILCDLVKEVVIVKDSQFLVAIKDLSRLTQSQKIIFSDVILGRNVTIADCQDAIADVLVTPTENSLIIRRSGIFLDKLHYRLSNSSPGEKRLEFFDRKIGDLVARAASIKVHDPYILKNLSNPRSGACWFVEEIQKYKTKVILHTAYPKREKSETFSAYLQRRKLCIENSIAKLESLNPPSSEFGLELFVHEPSSEDKHDRFCSIWFYKGCVSGQLQKGLEIFAKDPLKSAKVLEPFQSQANYDSAVESWESQVKPEAYVFFACAGKNA